MKWTSISAIYFLLFIASAFFLLPFGVKTHEEVGAERIPGQADSAPHTFDLKRHLVRASLLAAVLTIVFYVNYVNGWVTADDFDFYN